MPMESPCKAAVCDLNSLCTLGKTVWAYKLGRCPYVTLGKVSVSGSKARWFTFLGIMSKGPPNSLRLHRLLTVPRSSGVLDQDPSNLPIGVHMQTDSCRDAGLFCILTRHVPTAIRYHGHLMWKQYIAKEGGQYLEAVFLCQAHLGQTTRWTNAIRGGMNQTS